MKDNTSICATAEKVERTIFMLLTTRDSGASICPSEVARAIAQDEDDWRPLMPLIRQVAATLANKGSLQVTRGAEQVDAMFSGGPIRLRLPK